MSVIVHHGDSRNVLATLAAGSIDACVTDPPYGLTANKRGGSGVASVNLESPYGRARIGTGNGPGGFMGKKWDTGETAFDPAFWREVLRVLKPGGHLLAFGGTRTYHRLVCAIEDAGFEVRDQLAWLYGSGFPKSHDVSKAMDKAAGAERELTRPGVIQRNGYGDDWDTGSSSNRPRYDKPATDAARQWAGWGTALKPALEPICLARKPLIGTVAANVAAHGTGALNIGACRINASGLDPDSTSLGDARNSPAGSRVCTCLSREGDHASHTWHSRVAASSGGAPERHSGPPANDPAYADRRSQPLNSPAGYLLCPDCGGVLVRRQAEGGQAFSQPLAGAGELRGHSPVRQDSREGLSTCGDNTTPNVQRQGRWPSNVLLDGSAEATAGFPDTGAGQIGGNNDPNGSLGYHGGARGKSAPGIADSGSASRYFYSAKADAGDRLGSKHPTVKPIDLMAYLCRLITPPGGAVLDPFAGSGTTGMACLREGFDAVLIEREAEYVADIRRRIAHVSGQDAPLFSGAAT